MGIPNLSPSNKLSAFFVIFMFKKFERLFVLYLTLFNSAFDKISLVKSDPRFGRGHVFHFQDR